MSRILVVEDMRPIQKLLETILKGDGYEVVLANNGKEAFELVEQEDFDLILLDIMMPVMGGLDFLKLSSQKNKNLKVCMLTAKEESESIQECIGYGALDYIVKPTNKDTILEKVDALINNRMIVKSPSIKTSIPLTIYSVQGESLGQLLYLFEDKAIIENEFDFGLSDVLQIQTRATKRYLGFELDIVCKVTTKKESKGVNGYIVHFIGVREDFAKKIRSFAFTGKEISEVTKIGA